MATTVVSVVIFLCGVLVGRNVRAEAPAAESPEAIAAAPVDEAPAAAGEAPSAEPTPLPQEQLTYHDRLQQPKPKDELKPQEAKPEPPAAPEPAPAAVPTREPDVEVPTSGRPGTWVIQVHALSNRNSASAVVKGLIAKGYPAFLALPARGEPVRYRVQIGRYRDRAEAEQVARRLQKEEQFRPEIKR
jgi:cell division septation protein DedD